MVSVNGVRTVVWYGVYAGYVYIIYIYICNMKFLS